MRRTQVRHSRRTSRETITPPFRISPTVETVHPAAGYPFFQKKVVQNGEFRCTGFQIRPIQSPFGGILAKSSLKMIAFIRFWTGDRSGDHTPVAQNEGIPLFSRPGEIPESHRRPDAGFVGGEEGVVEIGIAGIFLL